MERHLLTRKWYARAAQALGFPETSAIALRNASNFQTSLLTPFFHDQFFSLSRRPLRHLLITAEMSRTSTLKRARDGEDNIVTSKRAKSEATASQMLANTILYEYSTEQASFSLTQSVIGT